jgi:hypothetical protein
VALDFCGGRCSTVLEATNEAAPQSAEQSRTMTIFAARFMRQFPSLSYASDPEFGKSILQSAALFS